MSKSQTNQDATPCVAVFTCRGRERILREGGSQAWRMSTNQASKRGYIVCVQNRNQGWGNATHPHHTAFLVGKISGVVSSKGNDDRKLVKISEYADIDIPDAWEGGRNPVAYMTLEEFGIDLKDLEFHPVSAAPFANDDEAFSDDGNYEDEVAPLTIEGAKKGLASYLGVTVEQIEITIKA